MKFAILTLLATLSLNAHAEYKNVPSYTFEATSRDSAQASADLAKCQDDLAQRTQELVSKGFKIVLESKCSIRAIEGDQIPSTYTVSGAILFL